MASSSMNDARIKCVGFLQHTSYDRANAQLASSPGCLMLSVCQSSKNIANVVFPGPSPGGGSLNGK